MHYIDLLDLIFAFSTVPLENKLLADSCLLEENVFSLMEFCDRSRSVDLYNHLILYSEIIVIRSILFGGIILGCSKRRCTIRDLGKKLNCSDGCRGFPESEILYNQLT